MPCAESSPPTPGVSIRQSPARRKRRGSRTSTDRRPAHVARVARLGHPVGDRVDRHRLGQRLALRSGGLEIGGGAGGFAVSDQGRDDGDLVGVDRADGRLQQRVDHRALAAFELTDDGHADRALVEAGPCAVQRPGQIAAVLGDGQLPAPVQPGQRLVDQLLLAARNRRGRCGGPAACCPVTSRRRRGGLSRRGRAGRPGGADRRCFCPGACRDAPAAVGGVAGPAAVALSERRGGEVGAVGRGRPERGWVAAVVCGGAAVGAGAARRPAHRRRAAAKRIPARIGARGATAGVAVGWSSSQSRKELQAAQKTASSSLLTPQLEQSFTFRCPDDFLRCAQMGLCVIIHYDHGGRRSRFAGPATRRARSGRQR